MSHIRACYSGLSSIEYITLSLKKLDENHLSFGQTIVLHFLKDQPATLCWNGETYDFFYDQDFWKNSKNLSTHGFLNLVKQEYRTMNAIADQNFYLNKFQTLKSTEYNTTKTIQIQLQRGGFF